jgi:hypothetical protein
MLNKLLGAIGYKLVKNTETNSYPDFEQSFLPVLSRCKPYTMTSAERLYSVYKSIEYIEKANIEGAIVECGVWRGGSTMCALLALKEHKNFNREVFLYDTYEGMSEPTDKDKDILGEAAAKQLANRTKNEEDVLWAYATLDRVKENIEKTGYPSQKIKYVKGKVEDTIPATIPDKIALLRLDTDWYESTWHEMVHLFPKLVKGGVIIIDDYGHWAGAREAVDTYLKQYSINMLLNRIDYTGRIGIKP